MYDINDIWDQLNCGDHVFVGDSSDCGRQSSWATGFIHKKSETVDPAYIEIYTKETGIVDGRWRFAVKVSPEFGSRLTYLLELGCNWPDQR